MLSKILREINNLPETLKAIIALISTVIPTLALFRTNVNLGVVVLCTIVIIALFSHLAYIALSKDKPGIGFQLIGAKVTKPPYRKRWAIVGICVLIVICAVLLVLKPTRYYILAALKGTEVIPQADIIIAQFDSGLASKKFEIPNRIKTDLERELQKHKLQDLKIDVLSAPITSKQEAQSVAEQSVSKIVVWGLYDDLGIAINFYPLKSLESNEEALNLKEIAWNQGSELSADISFKIREKLPENITFLSLFIVGNIYYQNNEYQKGHQAIDAAMANLPKEIGLENEGILHFFYARNIESTNPQDVESAICEYSKAIEMNPTLASAYNNLGIIIANLYFKHESQYGVYSLPFEDETPEFKLPGKGEECLEKIVYDDEQGTITSFLFDKAFGLQPNSAIFQFNRLANKWFSYSGNTRDGPEIVKELDDILQKDPSIAGAHVMRGILAFDKGERFIETHSVWDEARLAQSIDLAKTLNKEKPFEEDQFKTSLQRFSTASQLLPNSSELYINVGKVYMRKRMYDEALIEFKKAVELNPTSLEANLSIADLTLRQGQANLALQYLNAINYNRPEYDLGEYKSGFIMVAILKSRIHFESGDLKSAIKSLESIPQHSESSLVNYLLGLLYAKSSNSTRAKASFKKCDGLTQQFGDPEFSSYRDEKYHENFTDKLVWYDLNILCASSSKDVSSWGVKNQCLPLDITDRLKKTFDIAQNRIVYRIFYRQKQLFGPLLCPYVFTFHPQKNEWIFDTTILYKLNRKDLEKSQSRSLQRFNGSLIIREIEPEISYIDEITVIAFDRFGQSHILRPDRKALQTADNEYLIIKQGDEVHLNFDGYSKIKGATHFRIKAKGYYTPLNKSS